MAYLYEMYLVIEGDSEDLEIQNFIDSSLNTQLEKRSDINYVGSRITELTKNAGKCCKCGGWVSDHDKEGSIEGFSDGVVIDGEWWCDLCLPETHPKKF